MKFVDLGPQYARLKTEINRRIKTVAEHSQYINGPRIGILEIRLAKRTESKYCVSMANGCKDLLLALMAAGIQEDDESFAIPFTCVAIAPPNQKKHSSQPLRRLFLKKRIDYSPGSLFLFQQAICVD